MASIEEEIMASRRAANEIAESDAERQAKEREGRLRAEMMARYSGGRKGVLDIATPSSTVKLAATWLGGKAGAKEVYAGEKTPMEYFAERPSDVNYTGIGRLTPHAEGMSDVRSVLKVTPFSSNYRNDFVSALYNGETPLEELGVSGIGKGSRDVYQKILGKNYENVTGDNFRGYQISKESLPFYPELDEAVRKGNYSQKLMPYSVQGESDWSLGDTGHFYDAGAYQRVVVERNGKKYYKLVDVFDTKGTNSGAVDKGVNEAISRYEKPFVVSTPWRELPAWRE